MLGGGDEQWPEHRPERRGEHHLAHRSTAVGRLGEIGGGIAGEEVRRLAAAEQEQPDDEHREHPSLGTEGGDHPANGGNRSSRAATQVSSRGAASRRESVWAITAVPVVTVAVAMPPHGVSSPRMS